MVATQLLHQDLLDILALTNYIDAGYQVLHPVEYPYALQGVDFDRGIKVNVARLAVVKHVPDARRSRRVGHGHLGHRAVGIQRLGNNLARAYSRPVSIFSGRHYLARVGVKRHQTVIVNSGVCCLGRANTRVTAPRPSLSGRRGHRPSGSRQSQPYYSQIGYWQVSASDSHFHSLFKVEGTRQNQYQMNRLSVYSTWLVNK